jgi:two-component system phosphate regulon sensor histidine kinase PhoR
VAETRSPLVRFRSSIFARAVLLEIALVVTTAIGISVVLVQAVNAWVERNAEERLRDGASYFLSALADERQTLYTVGSILAAEPSFAAAVGDGNSPAVHEWLRLTARSPIDQVLLVSADGRVVDSAVTSSGSPPTVDTANTAFRQALAGHASDTWAFDRSLQQQVNLPLQVGAEARMILRLVAEVDEKELDAFRARTGLDASLFRAGTRLATTLRDQQGQPVDPTAGTGVVDQVEGQGKELFRVVTLPGGSLRSYYVPLRAASGSVVGMFAVSLPLSAVIGEFRNGLWPALPLTLLILAFGGLVPFWLTKRVTRPVLLLAQAAARMRSGDLDTPVPEIHEPEFEALRDELDQARRNLQTNLQAVTAQEATERALVSAVRDPVLVATSDGTVNLFNAAAAAWFGGAFRLSNRRIQEVLPFLPPGAMGQAEGLWQGTVTTDRGREVDLEAVKSVIEVDGSPPMHVYVVHDISQHAELNRLREQLLYDVAHELRGPMGILDNALDIVATDYGSLSTEEFESLMGSARRTVTRLHQLMEDLLGAGSIQAGRFQVDPRPTELGIILSAATEAIEPLLQDRKLDTSQVDETAMVLADRRYIRNALVNLLTNAIKYSPDGSLIRVVTSRVKDDVRIAVIDSGQGLTAEQQAGLFDRFYRVRPKGERGIGLGLAIVKGIVEAHGGNVGVSSQPGAGSEFWFTLPLAQPPRLGLIEPVEVTRI